MDKTKSGVTILGIFVADLAFYANKMPAVGETIAGSGFALGPGGKGSNQAVAAARASFSPTTDVTFISSLGTDDFAAIARATWNEENINAVVKDCPDHPTGAAFIYVNDANGENAIIVVPGAAATISATDVQNAADHIKNANVFITQLEQPIPAAMHALEIARAADTITIFNPAPAEPVPEAIFALCDYITPNETEAAALTGITVKTVEDAKKAADILLEKGVGTALITLGETGALLHNTEHSILIPAINAGNVLETAGAGDAFNGGFAAALAHGMAPLEAAKFATAVAGISVTRAGTAPSMPHREEVMSLLENMA